MTAIRVRYVPIHSFSFAVEIVFAALSFDGWLVGAIFGPWWGILGFVAAPMAVLAVLAPRTILMSDRGDCRATALSTCLATSEPLRLSTDESDASSYWACEDGQRLVVEGHGAVLFSKPVQAFAVGGVRDGEFAEEHPPTATRWGIACDGMDHGLWYFVSNGVLGGGFIVALILVFGPR
ncbi:hypothetical protein [Nostocoides jenkinsii]|jgi:hypothetical protein|uniref:Uncharacterized protein n=1 Tax=Nostocoides jenkinsii Ben 74 TaxID=1193518 RepID=A0A077M6V8_9MICO|nr:hypothetical protein [Tetrasphaera jenkinsii]CCI53011.1 membrane hypothetical protein [Tetrasphaera jenkinsii Ben 74]